MLPYSLSSAVASAGAGIFVSRTGAYRTLIWASFAIFTLGMGLMTRLNGTSSTWVICLPFGKNWMTSICTVLSKRFSLWLRRLAWGRCSRYVWETAEYFSTLTLGFVGAAYSTSGCYAVEGHGGVNFDLWLPQVLSSRVYVYSKFIDALCRSLGGTVGISIGQAIYSSVGHLNLGMNQNSMLYFSRY